VATYVRPAISAYCQVASSSRLCGTGFVTSVFSGPAGNYALSKTGSSYTVKDNVGADGSRTFTNIVRLQFTNAVLAFDVDGNAGKAYRLYQAAFDRVPDRGGLGFWIHALDSGTSLEVVASNFISSQEFKNTYGENLSNGDFVTALYANVLHRAPDQSGYDYWVGLLNTGYPRENVLVAFSEGFENRAAVLPAIAENLYYTRYTP
jgi:hypothetical protein